MSQRVKQFLEELHAAPRKFDEDGSAYHFLQEFFHGEPLQTLIPLLRNRDTYVQRAAMFVVSELGEAAHELVDEVLPLLYVEDPIVRRAALEVIAVCSREHESKQPLVASMLCDNDMSLRVLAMELLLRASMSELSATRRYLPNTDQFITMHERGLLVLEHGSIVALSSIREMILNDEPLLRKYGAIAVYRQMDAFRELADSLRESSDDDLVKFTEKIERQLAFLHAYSMRPRI